MKSRFHAASAYASLKAATRLVISDLGGIDAAAASSRAGRSLISDYQNPSTDRYMPSDIILDAETIGGTPHITAALARAQGYELCPVEPRDRGQVSTALARLGKSVGTLFGTVADAFADGRLTEQERQDLIRDLDQVIRVGGEARAILLADADCEAREI